MTDEQLPLKLPTNKNRKSLTVSYGSVDRPKCECGADLVRLESGRLLCKDTLDKFKALYGYEPE